MRAYQYNSKTRQLERINLDHHKDKIPAKKHIRNMSREEIDKFAKEHFKEHEYDCQLYCEGCGRKFCDLKTEDNLNHAEELPEKIYSRTGEVWCHRDCN